MKKIIAFILLCLSLLIAWIILATGSTEEHGLTFNATTPVNPANVSWAGVIIKMINDWQINDVTLNADTDCTKAYINEFDQSIWALLETVDVSWFVASFSTDVTWGNEYVISCNSDWTWFNIWFVDNQATRWPITWTNLIWEYGRVDIKDTEDLEAVVSIEIDGWWSTWWVQNKTNMFHFFN